MKKNISITLFSIIIFGCAELSSVLQEVNDTTAPSTISLTNAEVINGLKEALTIGTTNSTSLTSKLDGFYKNPEIFIPFPENAIKVKEKVEAIGMKKQVDDFVLTLNRAAELASKEATPIFVDAIKQMTITDGFTILKGENNAATQYLKEKTSSHLKIKFNPIVKNAISASEVTKHWNPLITTYNKIPFTDKQNPDLEDYVTTKAMDGLFLMIQKEEANIRLNPAARVNDILKKVFGS